MSKCYHIIANHHSGDGRGKKAAGSIEKLMNQKQLRYQFYQTEYPGHAITLVEKVIKKMQLPFDRLWVIGGDGTLHEVVAGLKQLEIAVPVGYFPAGTGNDFARTWGIPLKIKKNLDRLLQAQLPQEVECFFYQKNDSISSGIGLNSLGIGFDAQVTKIAKDTASSRKKSFLATQLDRFVYLRSIAHSYKERKTFHAKALVDGRSVEVDQVLIIGVMNHPYFGGGIKIDPQSQPNDHELAVMIIKDLPVPTLLKLLIKVLTNGSHIHSRYFHRIAGKEISIHLHAPQMAQVDGELLGEETYHLHFGMTSFQLWL